MKPYALFCAAALITLSPASTALSQEKKIVTQATTQPGITPAQMKQAQSLFDEFDKKVMTGFVGEEALKASMSKDLRAIDALKDPKQKMAAIDTYQKKYAGDYLRILKKGGADVNALAASLNGLFKGRKFTVVNSLYATSVTSTDTPPTVSTPAPAPTARTFQLSTNDFAFDGNPRCGGAAGAGNSFSGMKMRSDIFSTLAGGCFNSAGLRLDRTVASATVETLTVKADVDVWALAIAVGGTSLASSRANLYVYGELPDFNTEVSKEVEVFAPALWVAYAADNRQNAQIVQWAPAGKAIGIHANSGGYTMSLLTSGNSTGSEIRLNQVKVTVAPQ